MKAQIILEIRTPEDNHLSRKKSGPLNEGPKNTETRVPAFPRNLDTCWAEPSFVTSTSFFHSRISFECWLWFTVNKKKACLTFLSWTIRMKLNFRQPVQFDSLQKLYWFYYNKKLLLVWNRSLLIVFRGRLIQVVHLL